MKRSPLECKQALTRKTSLRASPQKGSQVRQKPMKRSQPKRDWTDAREKVQREGCCRICGRMGEFDAAHIIGRENDQPKRDADLYYLDGNTLYVHPDSIVPLCRNCHTAYDEHRYDLLPMLHLHEQVRAVQDAGGIELARQRTAPSQYRNSPEREDA